MTSSPATGTVWGFQFCARLHEVGPAPPALPPTQVIVAIVVVLLDEIHSYPTPVTALCRRVIQTCRRHCDISRLFIFRLKYGNLFIYINLQKSSCCLKS